MQEIKRILVTIQGNGNSLEFETQKGKSLFELLREKEMIPFSHCGGKGVCGNCQVRFLKGAPLPKAGDRKAFQPEELRAGFRLACLVCLEKDCDLELCFLTKESKGISVVTKTVDGHSDNQIKIFPDKEETTMIAIDLGTTTIAMELRGIETGFVYETFCAVNPQRSYGADVISRIQASNQGYGEELKQLVWKCVEEGIGKLSQFAEENRLCKPREAYLAGNTPMGQIFMGYSLENLGKFPFLPENINMQSTSISGIQTILMPGISAFVGGDIVSGMYYIKKNMGGFCETKHSLLIDLGTNGEMAIGNGNRILTTATAAGPAFEGGCGSSIMGADLIACLDELKSQGILDETGLLKEPWFEKGAFAKGTNICQKDIRALQMAKAAVFAGICILVEQFGISINQIDQVYLAGGFGYFLNVESALSIGLIPMELKEKVRSVGNTSLAGAYLYGRNRSRRKSKENSQRRMFSSEKDEIEKLVESCETLNLAEKEEFGQLYINAMELKPLYYKDYVL